MTHGFLSRIYCDTQEGTFMYENYTKSASCHWREWAREEKCLHSLNHIADDLLWSLHTHTHRFKENKMIKMEGWLVTNPNKDFQII
jgi:hypothetical protein